MASFPAPPRSTPGWVAARLEQPHLRPADVAAAIDRIEARKGTVPWTVERYPGSYAMDYLCAHPAEFGYDSRLGLSRSSLATWLEEVIPEVHERDSAIVHLAEAHMREHRIFRTPYTLPDIAKIQASAYLRRHHDLDAS